MDVLNRNQSVKGFFCLDKRYVNNIWSNSKNNYLVPIVFNFNVKTVKPNVKTINVNV
jgi:hypothetical protein